MENLVIKKFVLDVDGAFEVLKVLGFRENGVAKKAYLEVPEDAVNLGFLNRTIDLLTSKADDLDAAEKTATAPAAAKVLCSGGCGFWGDAKYESLCSICYKKKKVLWGHWTRKQGSRSNIVHSKMWLVGLCKIQWNVQSVLREDECAEAKTLASTFQERNCEGESYEKLSAKLAVTANRQNAMLDMSQAGWDYRHRVSLPVYLLCSAQISGRT